jgi:hypothetical protein
MAQRWKDGGRTQTALDTGGIDDRRIFSMTNASAVRSCRPLTITHRRFNMSYRVKLAAVAFFAVVGQASAQQTSCPSDMHDSQWRGSSTIITPYGGGPGVDCQRVYHCNGEADSGSVPSGCKVVATSSKSITGKCSMDSDSGSCRKCETDPPSEQCQWHLEQQ